MHKNIPRIQAQSYMSLLAVSDYPHLTREGRETIYDSFKSIAYPEEKNKLPEYLSEPVTGLQVFTVGQANRMIKGR